MNMHCHMQQSISHHPSQLYEKKNVVSAWLAILSRLFREANADLVLLEYWKAVGACAVLAISVVIAVPGVWCLI
jgi:hypothetical protein